MKKRSVIACMFSGLIGLLGCSLTKSMPDSELVSIEYTRSGTMAGYVYEGRVMVDSNDSFMVQAMKEDYGSLYEKKIGKEEMQRFYQIIKDEKMYKYKEKYKPLFKVLDGWSWSFRAAFADGTTISSSGFNARPKSNGLQVIKDYMKELVVDGIIIEGTEKIK